MLPEIQTIPLHFDKANLKPNDYKSDVKPVWCPGCGDFGVLSSFYKAVSELGIPPEQLVIASGIGCSGRFPAFCNSYGFHGVHGRVLPLATGIKMARPELVVCAMGGDGDGFSIGMGHFPHAARRNVDITYIVMDNEIYGLTKGQASPTSPLGLEKKSTPYGNVDRPLNPLLLAFTGGATWIGRAFSSRPKEMTELIKQAIAHKGFSFLQVYSPCVTFYDTYDHFKQVTKPLPEGHDASDKAAGMLYAMNEETLFLGKYYQEERPTYDDAYSGVRQKATKGTYSFEKLMDKYRR
ncbi:MAG: 2-oxoglutarate oxidoreductase subunit KorB [Anaerolineae bacterium]|nr:2-oxoglutarate oxidoreductase subunit KorB [Anaerolineae bacterium]MDL1897449.1 2-oxoacid:ferredoxin oxidoreductase subunit beta [Anaerolineae bacterium CFX7]RIK34185.1 MAG: 2-oxoacid ferredoxin oxidoreductase [Chloroflexota bacterium]